eukprot:4503735-Amphidinium_carterae.1
MELESPPEGPKNVKLRESEWVSECPLALAYNRRKPSRFAGSIHSNRLQQVPPNKIPDPHHDPQTIQKKLSFNTNLNIYL